MAALNGIGCEVGNIRAAFHINSCVFENSSGCWGDCGHGLQIRDIGFFG